MPADNLLKTTVTLQKAKYQLKQHLFYKKQATYHQKIVVPAHEVNGGKLLSPR